MKTIIIILYIFISANLIYSQYDWERLSYTHNSSYNIDNSKTYYIITIENNGSGKLEYFRSGKVNIKNFKVSRKNLNFLNEKIEKSGVYKLNPKSLFSENTPADNENSYSMTLTLEKEFGEEYDFKFEEKPMMKKDSEKEEDEAEKPQVIPVPGNINPKYKKTFYNLYYDIERIVPYNVWKEASSE